MPESSQLEIFDNEGHISYDKVVEIVHLNFKNFLNSILDESFTLASDDSYRIQINETSLKIRDQALDAFIERKHIVSSEFYVELETSFYTTSSTITELSNNDHNANRSMDTDLIELALVIDQLVERCVSRHSDIINRLTQQLEELSFLAHRDFNTSCLQPQDFYKLIQNCIAPLNIPADGKILISKLLHENIAPNLNDFYMAMHNFLLDVNISPSKNIDHEISDEKDSNNDPRYNSSIMSMSTGQFYAPIEQEKWQQEYDNHDDYVGKHLSTTPDIVDDISMDVYGPGQTGLDEITVSLLLQPYSSNTQSDSSPAQRRQFVRALSSVQRVEASSNAIFKPNQIKTAVRRTLQEKGALDANEIVDNEEKVIDFVSNIFHVILQDDAICNPMKDTLSRLQISTIKLALIDFTFFQNPRHPSRQLLNKLTSIGTIAGEDNQSLFIKLNTIVRNITDSFETDVQIFELALTEIQDLDIFPSDQDATKEKIISHQHKLKSQRSAAKRVVIHTIKKFTAHKETPYQILEFCLKCWAPHMAYIYMNYGRTTKEWRSSVRTLRRIIEISQHKPSLNKVSKYIHFPNEFFKNIRADLEYFTSRKDEFEEVLEEAEVWYLTYLRKIELEDNELHYDSAILNPESSNITEDQDNVIHLFKNLAPIATTTTELATEDKEDKADNEVEVEIPEIVTAQPIEAVEINTDSESNINETVNSEESLVDLGEQKEAQQNGSQHELASELDSETEFDENDIEEEPQLNIAEHLPESIVPGVWLEIYQGEDRAKRRLKFSEAIIETNYLVFSDRSGDYNFEIDLQTFMDDLSAGRSSLISESNRFDLALSSVISNIRSNQENSDTS
ncbi:MAG: DUF1631 family protein [Gammaproteobacteria bacterium]